MRGLSCSYCENYGLEFIPLLHAGVSRERAGVGDLSTCNVKGRYVKVVNGISGLVVFGGAGGTASP